MQNTELERTDPFEIHPPGQIPCSHRNVTPIFTRLCLQPFAHLDFVERLYAKPLRI